MTTHPRTPSPPGWLAPSAEAVEGQMVGLRHESGARILGLNAARLFRRSVPYGKVPA